MGTDALPAPVPHLCRTTPDRTELEFAIEGELVGELVTSLDRRLARFHHRGVVSPRTVHYVTTTYFDTTSREVFRRASQASTSVKLRTKAYYDVIGDLAELGGLGSQPTRSDDIVWLELKRRAGARTRKHRVGVARPQLRQTLTELPLTPGSLAGCFGLHGDDTGTALSDLHLLPGTRANPLRPDCLVNYWRMAWQSPSDPLRVTIDGDLAFFAPPGHLLGIEGPLVRAALGQPVAESAVRILEIKTPHDPPPWLVRLLDRLGCRSTTGSKFLQASRAVHATGAQADASA